MVKAASCTGHRHVDDPTWHYIDLRIIVGWGQVFFCGFNTFSVLTFVLSRIQIMSCKKGILPHFGNGGSAFKPKFSNYLFFLKDIDFFAKSSKKFMIL